MRGYKEALWNKIVCHYAQLNLQCDDDIICNTDSYQLQVNMKSNSVMISYDEIFSKFFD